MTGTQIINTAMEKTLEASETLEDILQERVDLYGIAAVDQTFQELANIIDANMAKLSGFTPQEALNIALAVALRDYGIFDEWEAP